MMYQILFRTHIQFKIFNGKTELNDNIVNICNKIEFDVALTGRFIELYLFIILISIVTILKIFLIKAKRDKNYDDIWWNN